MSLKRTVAPTDLPVTLEEAKAHLRVVGTTEDADVMTYLRAAVAHLDGPEGVLNRAICTQTLVLTLDKFPRGRSFDLPLSPLVSVTSIKYLDTTGAEQAWAGSNYRVLNAATPTTRGRVTLAYSAEWPVHQDVEQAITVAYVAGYGARNAVPDHIRALVLARLKGEFDLRDPATTTAYTETPAYRGLMEQARFPVAG